VIKKIVNPKLKNSLFKIIPIPYDDELFSSWFIRTAYAHNTHPHTFYKLYINNNAQAMYANNFDAIISKKEILRLENKCSNKIKLYNLTLKSYSGYLQENIVDNGFNKLLCDIRYCPKCLREDKVVYFRKQWKIIFNAVCTKHQCYLYDKCPKCNDKLNISKMYQNKLSFKYCSNCGFDLSKSRVLPISKILKHNSKYIKLLNNILTKGYIILQNKMIYSFYFFDAILQLSKKILKHKKYKYIQDDILFKQLDIKKTYSTYEPVHTQISIKDQFALFALVVKLFENYPKSLSRYIKVNNLSHWQMIKDMGYVSFWYENLINGIIPRHIPITKFITQEEIENGKKYLISKNILVNKASLSRLFGCSFFSVYNKLGIE